jgi:hypothetical protein
LLLRVVGILWDCESRFFFDYLFFVIGKSENQWWWGGRYVLVQNSTRIEYSALHKSKRFELFPMQQKQ